MIPKQEVLEIAKDSLKKFNLKAEVKFLPYHDFLSLAKKSPIIFQSLKEGNKFSELNIPALIYHEKKEHLYFSEKILKKLLYNEPVTLQRRFIEAILYHEIFHIIYKNKIKHINFNSELNQEDLITSKFRKEYPALEALGREVTKKYIKS